MYATSAAAAILLIGGLLACGSGGGPPASPSPGSATTPPPTAAPKRLLVVTHTAGFRHDSIPIAETTLQELGSGGLYTVDYCRTADDVKRMLTGDSLATFDGVFFANTTGNIGIPDMAAFLQWITKGGAFLGAHSATDTYHDSAEFIEMIGGEFQTHGSIVETDVRVDDASHPAVAHLGQRFTITDELYRFNRFNADKVRRLLTMDRNPSDGVGTAGAPADLPMAWHRAYGEGRVFYTAFGHRREVWQDARYRQHIREAIRWALKQP